MSEGLEMDANLVEIYQQRMTQIQDVSDVIAVANMQLNKTLAKLGWSKQSLLKEDGLEVCPLDEHHRVHKDKLQDHVRTCVLRKHKMMSIRSEDIPVPPVYDSQSSVIPVFVSKAQYKKLGVNFDNDIETNKLETIIDLDATLLEDDEGINDYKPCNALDELRFIYSWHKIPRNYVLLDITRIPKVELNAWLVEKISHMGTSDEVKISMVNSMMCWLNELPTPSQICSYVHDLFGEHSASFVLCLWKFLAAKCLCLSQQIPEHTRHEFDFYTTTSMSTPAPNVENVEKNSPNENIYPSLPADWIFHKLKTCDKLALYDDICKTSKSLKMPSLGISELEIEAQDQVRLLTEFDESSKGIKTRMEVMAELRDYKRRRQAYRGKRKSDKKLSAIEVIRELFDQQMLYLKLTQESERPIGEKVANDNSTDANPDKLVHKEKGEKHDNVSRRKSRSSSREHRRGSKQSRSKELKEHCLDRWSRRSTSHEQRSRSHKQRSRSRERRSKSRDRRRKGREQRSKSRERGGKSRERRSKSRERRSRSRERSGRNRRRRSYSKDTHYKSNPERPLFGRTRYKSDGGMACSEVSNKTYYENENEESKPDIKIEEGSSMDNTGIIKVFNEETRQEQYLEKGTVDQIENIKVENLSGDETT